MLALFPSIKMPSPPLAALETATMPRGSKVIMPIPTAPPTRPAIKLRRSIPWGNKPRLPPFASEEASTPSESTLLFSCVSFSKTSSVSRFSIPFPSFALPNPLSVKWPYCMNAFIYLTLGFNEGRFRISQGKEGLFHM